MSDDEYPDNWLEALTWKLAQEWDEESYQKMLQDLGLIDDGSVT